MSIKTKLDRLDQTKNSIKSAILNNGGTLADDASFNDYAAAISNIGSGVTEEQLNALTTVSTQTIIYPSSLNTELFGGNISYRKLGNNFIICNVTAIPVSDLVPGNHIFMPEANLIAELKPSTPIYAPGVCEIFKNHIPTSIILASLYHTDSMMNIRNAETIPSGKNMHFCYCYSI